MPLAKSSVLTSGLTLSRITSPAMVGVKFRRMPNSLKMTVTALFALTTLDDRNRKLASGEEARLLAVVGNQVRFGEALECALLLQGAERARR